MLWVAGLTSEMPLFHVTVTTMWMSGLCDYSLRLFGGEVYSLMKVWRSMTDVRLWAERLGDQRSGRVVFLSHCLLNENTRYLGGACRQGCIQEIVQTCVERGLGIVQMPCPEQVAWGGVLKRRLLVFFGSEGTLLYGLRSMLFPVLVWYTRRACRKLAKQMRNQVKDYVSSGFTVAGIIGVDGSPTCGVHRTLDAKRSLELVGRLSESSRAKDMNAIVETCLAEGSGTFIESLRNQLRRHRLNPPFLAHDLIAELQGKPLELGL
jgi:predicted secreted protein